MEKFKKKKRSHIVFIIFFELFSRVFSFLFLEITCLEIKLFGLFVTSVGCNYQQERNIVGVIVGPMSPQIGV